MVYFMAVKFGGSELYSTSISIKHNVGDIVANTNILAYTKNIATTTTTTSNLATCSIGINGCFESVTYKLLEEVIPVYMPVTIGISPEQIKLNMIGNNTYSATSVACVLLKRIAVDLTAIKFDDGSDIDTYDSLRSTIATSDLVYTLSSITPVLTLDMPPILTIKDTLIPQSDFQKTTFT